MQVMGKINGVFYCTPSIQLLPLKLDKRTQADVSHAQVEKVHIYSIKTLS